MERYSLQINSFLFSLLAVLAFSTNLYSQTDTDVGQLQASAQAAEEWVKLLDQNKFQDSWDTGSMTFRLTVPKRNWTTLMENIRKPFGKVQSRKIVDLRTSKNPKGLPAGDYMVVFFETTFDNKKVAHELVTLALEKDGKWRVLTYQIQ